MSNRNSQKIPLVPLPVGNNYLNIVEIETKFNIILLMQERVGGQAMNKEEQVIMGFRDLYNKMVWLNKSKMEDSLKGYTSSEVHCIEYIEKMWIPT